MSEPTLITLSELTEMAQRLPNAADYKRYHGSFCQLLVPERIPIRPLDAALSDRIARVATFQTIERVRDGQAGWAWTLAANTILVV